jgi:hypothetical protein
MYGKSIKQGYVAPQSAKQAKVTRETLGFADFAGEPAAGLHLEGTF